ncbi:MAG: agmatinase [Peptococcaceae bacterium]|nr:agmatinase [Peptococcaceae bacterium]
MFTEVFSGFMGSSEDYESSSAVILGAPLDQTVSFRPGARHGPRQIRSVSEVLEEYSPRLDRDLADFVYSDLGDVAVVPGHVEESLERIAQCAGKVFLDGKLLVMLGGEHLVTLPAVQRAAQLYPELAVVQFDAHADLRERYLGMDLSHATVMRRIFELIGGARMFQFGIRSGTREEFALARSSVNFHSGIEIDDIVRTARRLKGKPVYITLDIDVFDPAYAPGTGTPEPGGCAPDQLFSALEAFADLNVIGFDLVEVCPPFDQSDRTAILAAKLVREAILLFAGNNSRQSTS